LSGAEDVKQNYVSKPDLIRFCEYNLHLTKAYDNREFITLILTKKAPTVKAIDYQCLKFTPIIVNLGERDADATIRRLRQQIEDGTPVNELEIVYLPLYHSNSLNPAEILKQCVEIISKVDATEERKTKLAALAMVASNKLVDKEDLDKIWEDVKKMVQLKILQVAEEHGIAIGQEQGIAIGQEQGIAIGQEQGKEQGIDISTAIIRALKANEVVESIAERFKVSIDRVMQIQSALIA